MTTSWNFSDQRELPRAEVLGLLLRAHNLGFCPRRVGTAVGASEVELAWLEQQVGRGRGAHEQPRLT